MREFSLHAYYKGSWSYVNSYVMLTHCKIEPLS